MALHLKNRRSVLLGATAIIGALTLMGQPAAAQDQPEYEFNIPAQPLNSALRAYGVAADQQLIFADADLRGRSAPPLKGSYTAEQALNTLLAGSGLYVHRRETGVLQISASPDPQSGSAAGDGADAGTVQALVVTAQKREENIQDVPIAMSAFTQESLTRSQVAGGPDLITQVPNMTFTKTNFSSYSIQIRGIGTQAISATTDPAVAVAFNNTPFVRNHFFEQEFYDLERVEVLRGPQGTLYGRNATAGVVNLISAKPKNHFEAKLSADVANYSSSRLEGMINLPLVADKAALRIAGEWTKRDGFVKNILTGQQTDGRDLWSGRVTLGLTPTDNFKANLIYEHFSENDDRLRSGKQLCHKDPAPAEINGVTIDQTASVFNNHSAAQFSQGCLPASLYSPDSFQTPNGYSLPYYGALAGIGSPVKWDLDPYLHSTQSRNLREIETHIKPEYEASNDVVELQLEATLGHDLTLTSETGFSHDYIFSFEDYNRFDTTPDVFVPDGDIVDANGVFCDPQLGCTNRLAAGDLSTANSKQFSQEFRLSSNFEGTFNFNLGANFLRYDTEDKYYVFINSVSAYSAVLSLDPWSPGSDSVNTTCFEDNALGRPNGYSWDDPNATFNVGGHCGYIDTNDIHHLNDEGRNYFLSKNPYHLLSYAAFGEVYYNITPTLKLTAGLRWTVDRKEAPQIPSWLVAALSYGTPTRKVIRQEWREPTGRLALDWKPQLSFTDQTLIYASYVRGYKAGGANPPPPVMIFPPICPPSCGGPNDAILLADSLTHPETFKPEFVNAYEIGTKNTLLGGGITFNLDAFYYDYFGYQISQIVDRSAVNLNFDAKVWGAELETDWRPLENLRLALKLGYENTRLAKGSSAIDLMDRTAGVAGWVLRKPFPSFPSNCIVPEAHAFDIECHDYILGTAGVDAPNNGDGFSKDLSGNSLPNAPHYTATVTADYTLPLPNAWLMTLHTDLYYQSEAWTRVFNTPGYDKLKAYNNVNFAAIFSNEDAGWQVMAYVKNVLNKDNITGAFLNSDDTGLTTNVFLTEPRLYGLRVTKNWSSSSWWTAHEHKEGGAYPLWVELEGYGGRFSDHRQYLTAPAMALFSPDYPDPVKGQGDLDEGTGGGMKVVYAPDPKRWSAAVAVRYGRAGGRAELHTKQSVPGGYIFDHKYYFNPSAGTITKPSGQAFSTGLMWFDFEDTVAQNSESHAIAEFTVGKDVGLGTWSRGGTESQLNVGLTAAHFKSTSKVALHGRPDLYFAPNDMIKYPTHSHRFNANLAADREFDGAGPSLAWDASLPLAGNPVEAGRVAVDVGVEGGVLFGRQKTHIQGEIRGAYRGGAVATADLYDITPPYQTPVDIGRTKSVTVPMLRANLGLSYEMEAVKISGGYKVERYYKVLDAGYTERRTFDRSFDGPYVKISVGFGG